MGRAGSSSSGSTRGRPVVPSRQAVARARDGARGGCAVGAAAEHGPGRRACAAPRRVRPRPGRGTSHGGRACDGSGRSVPTLGEGGDGGHLVVEQTVHRPAAAGEVVEARAFTAPAPAPGPKLADAQQSAGAAVLPALLDGVVEQVEDAQLGGGVDAPGDAADEPQRASLYHLPATQGTPPAYAGTLAGVRDGQGHDRRRGYDPGLSAGTQLPDPRRSRETPPRRPTPPGRQAQRSRRTSAQR